MSSSSFNVPLNITPYASVDNLPSTASENDIAVITEEEITNWCARADTPVGTAEGSIWIVTKNGGNAWFNVGSALSPVIIYPATVKQYVNGSWVYKDSYIYQSGNWKRIVYYLYDAGEDYDAVTGTLKILNSTGGRAVKNANDIYLGYTGSSDRVSGVFTNITVDVQSFTKLYIEYNMTAVNTSYGLEFGISDANTSLNVNNSINVLSSGYLTSTGQHVSMLDITSIDGEYYIGIRASVANANIYRIWLQ